MEKKLKKFALFLLILSFQFEKSFSQNSISQFAGIENSKFDYYAYSQEQSNWCWAASIQMILGYNHVSKTQEEIVRRTFGTNYKGDLPNLGGSIKNVTDNLNNWDVDRRGENYKVKSSFVYSPPTADEIVEILNRKDPIYLSYKSGPTTNHAVLITSCKYTNTPNGVSISQITVRDPWPSQENINNDGIVNYNFSDFQPLMNYYWVVTVKFDGDVFVTKNAIQSSGDPFINSIQKVLSDFENKFSNLKGEKMGDSENLFRTNIKFPKEKSSYINSGRLPYYYVRFYKGDNIDDANAAFEDLKKNFESIVDIKEESIFSSYPAIEDRTGKFKYRMINIKLDADRVITLKWHYSGKDSDKLKPYSVTMEIKTKEQNF